MNGIEKITARITAEAEAEAAAVLAEAEKNADEVRTAFTARAAEAEETLLRQGTEELEQKMQRADRAARLDAKKAILGLKQELVSAGYLRALEKIRALPEDRYVDFLARQAAAAAVSGREELILSGEDRKIGAAVVRQANALAAERGLPGELTLSEESRAFNGGVVLRSGAVEVNCTLDSLLEMSSGAMDAEVARILFL